jgi:hypothetical protein
MISLMEEILSADSKVGDPPNRIPSWSHIFRVAIIENFVVNKYSIILRKEDQVYGQKLVKMSKKHSSEAFYALDDPLEAAIFSVLVELMKELAEGENKLDKELRS